MTNISSPDWQFSHDRQNRIVVLAPTGIDPELLGRLPDRAADRLTKLHQMLEEVRDLSSSTTDRIIEEQAALLKAQGRLQDLTQNPASGHYLGPNGSEHPSVRQAEALVQKHADRLAELQEQATQRRQRRQLLSVLVERCEAYLKQVANVGGITPGKPKLVKGETVGDALARVRAERDALVSELNAVVSSPLDLPTAIGKMKAEIEALASSGAPRLDGFLRGDGNIGWPERAARSNLQGAFAVLPEGAGTASLMGAAHTVGTDALAVIVWANKDAIIRQLTASIEARYTGKTQGMSEAERQKRTTDLRAAILDNQRQEVALVDEARDLLLLTPDIDVRALLMIDGPAEPEVIH